MSYFILQIKPVSGNHIYFEVVNQFIKATKLPSLFSLGIIFVKLLCPRGPIVNLFNA